MSFKVIADTQRKERRKRERRNKAPGVRSEAPRREKVGSSLGLHRFPLPGDLSRHCQNKFMSKLLQKSPSTGAIM